MTRALPAPAPRLPSPPRIEPIAAGSIVHRVHHRDFSPAQFNPCQGEPTRFAPIHDADGECVPSLYAAGSLDAALYETVFHDVSAGGRFKSISRQRVLDREQAQLTLTRDMKLAALREPDLNKWGVTRNQLISSAPGNYGATAAWAQAVYQQFDDIDGLVWTSNQCDPDDAYLFFGTRVEEADFALAPLPAVSADERAQALMTAAKRAGKRASIWLTI